MATDEVLTDLFEAYIAGKADIDTHHLGILRRWLLDSEANLTDGIAFVPFNCSGVVESLRRDIVLGVIKLDETGDAIVSPALWPGGGALLPFSPPRAGAILIGYDFIPHGQEHMPVQDSKSRLGHATVLWAEPSTRTIIHFDPDRRHECMNESLYELFAGWTVQPAQLLPRYYAPQWLRINVDAVEDELCVYWSKLYLLLRTSYDHISACELLCNGRDRIGQVFKTLVEIYIDYGHKYPGDLVEIVVQILED